MRVFPLLLAIVALAYPGLAQNVVSGSEHPEAISDSTAQLVILASHSRLATPQQAFNTESHHGRIALTSRDHSAYDTQLMKFRTDYENLTSTYNLAIVNQSLQVRRGLQQQLANDLKALVNAHLRALELELSPDGLAKFKAFVQSEKAHMGVSQ